jgi:hypothetical protein
MSHAAHFLLHHAVGLSLFAFLSSRQLLLQLLLLCLAELSASPARIRGGGHLLPTLFAHLWLAVGCSSFLCHLTPVLPASLGACFQWCVGCEAMKRSKKFAEAREGVLLS